ncbi:MAG: hypothetical protein GY759_06560 [Chloroflexi bacterium]|nr:hypothetical protein [Chloroflexota bacterium]
MPLHTLSELTGDFVAYRSLTPFDSRVPGVRQVWKEMGLSGPAIVRKRDEGYPQAASWILERFHELHAPSVQLSELLLIGDTLGNDGGAYRRLAEYTGWSGSAFIGSERLDSPPGVDWQGDIYVANRWESIADWLRASRMRGLKLDERTIVVVDIDKTALGARGRNNRPIDITRLLGMRRTVQQALGADADQDAFAAIYYEFNQPLYHDLTGDNQDYLAYVSIMVGAGIEQLQDVQQAHSAGELNHFGDFIRGIQSNKSDLPPTLASLHESVYSAYLDGDPTPFKDFRRNEYWAAVASMANLPDDAPKKERLTHEICLTREVWDICRWLVERGAQITALSDKPDEACAPTPELIEQGYAPIHSTPTHLLGTSLTSLG